MNIFSLFARRKSAPVARERLQILLSHERAAHGNADLIALLEKEVLEAIGKHIEIDPDKVQVKMERRNDVSLLEIDVEIPTPRIDGKAPSAEPARDEARDKTTARVTMRAQKRAGQAA